MRIEVVIGQMSSASSGRYIDEMINQEMIQSWL